MNQSSIKCFFLFGLACLPSLICAESLGDRWLECAVTEEYFNGERNETRAGYLIRYLENFQVLVEGERMTFKPYDCQLSDLEIQCGKWVENGGRYDVIFNRASGSVWEWYEPFHEKTRNLVGASRLGFCEVRDSSKF